MGGSILLNGNHYSFRLIKGWLIFCLGREKEERLAKLAKMLGSLGLFPAPDFGSLSPSLAKNSKRVTLFFHILK